MTPIASSGGKLFPMNAERNYARSVLGKLLGARVVPELERRRFPEARTWLIGRVKEQVAIAKLEPMLEAGRIDASAKLPGGGLVDPAAQLPRSTSWNWPKPE
jgi:hypothetical protein